VFAFVLFTHWKRPYKRECHEAKWAFAQEPLLSKRSQKSWNILRGHVVLSPSIPYPVSNVIDFSTHCINQCGFLIRGHHYWDISAKTSYWTTYDFILWSLFINLMERPPHQTTILCQDYLYQKWERVRKHHTVACGKTTPRDMSLAMVKQHKLIVIVTR